MSRRICTCAPCFCLHSACVIRDSVWTQLSTRFQHCWRLCKVFLTALSRVCRPPSPRSPVDLIVLQEVPHILSSCAVCVCVFVCFCVGILWRSYHKEPGIMRISRRMENWCFMSGLRAFVLLIVGLTAGVSTHHSPDGRTLHNSAYLTTECLHWVKLI